MNMHASMKFIHVWYTCTHAFHLSKHCYIYTLYIHRNVCTLVQLSMCMSICMLGLSHGIPYALAMHCHVALFHVINDTYVQ